MPGRSSVVRAWVLGFVGLVTACGGCSEDSAPSNTDAGVLLDRCLMASDMAIIVASRTDAGASTDAAVPNPAVEAYDCTLTPACADLYLAEDTAGAYACVNDCLDSKPSGGLSLPCRDCYTLEAVSCAGEHCFLDCLSGSEESCTLCFEMFCRTALDACIGF